MERDRLSPRSRDQFRLIRENGNAAKQLINKSLNARANVPADILLGVLYSRMLNRNGQDSFHRTVKISLCQIQG